jgi:exodeoxyribonuclease VII large subunit
LNALNPLAILSRGYALVQRPDGKVLTHAEQAVVGEDLSVRMVDGRLAVRVTGSKDITPEGKHD